MGGSCSCQSCGRKLPSNVESEKEDIDRLVDELKVTTYTSKDSRYTSKDSRYYYINGDGIISPTLGYVDEQVKTKCYYCDDCFWRLKLKEEILMQHSTERGIEYLSMEDELSETNLEYLEISRDMNGLSSIATQLQPYKRWALDERNQDDDEDNESLLKKIVELDTGDESDPEDQEVDLHQDLQDLDEMFDQIIEMQPPNVITDFELDLQRSIQTSLLAIYATIHQLQDIQVDLISTALSQIGAEFEDFEFFEMTSILALLCKHSLSQITQATHDHGEHVDPTLQFFIELIAVSEDSCRTAFVESCISCLASVQLPQHDQELLNLIIVLYNAEQLWSSKDVLTLINLLKGHELSCDMEKMKLFLHYIQVYQVPFNDGVMNAIKTCTKPQHLISFVLNNFASKTKKDLEMILEETELDIKMKQRIEGILSNVLDSFGHETFHDLCREAKEALKYLDSASIADSEVEIDFKIAVAIRALYCGVHKCMNYRYYPSLTQLVSLCTLLLSHQHKPVTNCLLEVLTGEGKSCIIAMYAAALGMQGKTIDIVTSSEVLAKRDAQTWNDYFGLFDLSASDNIEMEELLSMGEDKINEKKQTCYGNAIVYGTITTFSADILRTEFELRNVRGDRGQQIVICDEVDMLMLDEGVQITYLSHRAAVLRHIEHVLALVWSAVCHNTPLVTITGEVLFAGAPKLFHNVIFEGITCPGLTDSTQLLKLAVKYEIITPSTLQQMMDPKSRKHAIAEFNLEKLIQFISQLEYHLPYNFQVYIMNKDNQLEQQMWARSTLMSEIPEQKRHNFSLLVISDGMARPLHSEKDLKVGVERVIANHLPKKCSPADIQPKEVLHTNDNREFTTGVFHYFHDTIFNAIVSCSKCRMERPERILDFAVKHKFMDKKTAAQITLCKNKKKALSDLNEEDMLKFMHCLSNDKDFPFKIAPFVQLPNEGGQIAPATVSGSTDHQPPAIYVLVKDCGLLCPLSIMPSDQKSLHEVHTMDGRTFWRGEPDEFHKVIFQLFNSTIVLQTTFNLGLMEERSIEDIMKAESRGNTIKPEFLDKIITLLNYLELFTPYTFLVYTQTFDSLLQLESKGHAHDGKKCQEISLLMNERGHFCQLLTKERIHIPSFLYSFIGIQLGTYIHSAFTALQMTEKREYIVKHGKISPVDYQNSGVVESNKHWGGGLQQMLEMKHHLKISPISVITNFVSHIEFFKRYTEIYGLSGTIGLDYELRMLKELYQIHALRIPPSIKKRFFEHKGVIIQSDISLWLNGIFLALKQETSSKQGMPGRAALVLCEDIQTVNEIEAFLWKKGLDKCHIYCRSDSKSSSLVIKRVLTPGDIVIATNLAGRGTDIQVDSAVIESGGLFCLLTFLPRNRRVELQAFGRTARQGNPGSAQVVLFAPTLPIQFREMDLSSIRTLREEQERRKLEALMKTDVKKVHLREELFSRHCQYLRNPKIQDLIKQREERSAIVDCINEIWGLWLQSKEKDIASLCRDQLFTQLSDLQNEWTHYLTSPDELKYLAKGNFVHLIKFGNSLAKSVQKDVSLASRAINFYEKSIRVETNYTAIAHYNLAYCRLCAGGDQYIEESISHLKKARELLDIQVEEVSIILQCMKVGQCKVKPKCSDKTALVNQMETRMNVLQVFGDKIDHNLQKLNELHDDIEIVPTSMLTLVPEPDLIAQVELHGLSELGLQFLFKVEKKKHFCWAGLLVFALGIAEIVAGVCIEAFTFGAGSTVALGFISEGVSDCIDGAIGMYTGEWSWTSWITMKACSIAISIATGGAGVFMKEAIEGVEVAAKEMPEVIEESAKQVEKATIKDTVKKVGEEFLVQGVMRALGEVENDFMEYVVEKIAEGVTGGVANSLQDCFSMKNPLGLIVDKLFVSKLSESYVSKDMMSPFLRKEAKDYFNQIVQQVVQDLVPPHSNELDIVKTSLSDLLLNTTNELKGKNSIFTTLELPMVLDSIASAVNRLEVLLHDFQPRMVEESGKAVGDQTVGYYDNLGCVIELKRTLARHATSAFTEAVKSIILDNLGWISNQMLNRTITRLPHLGKKAVDLASAGAEHLLTYSRSWVRQRNIRRIVKGSGMESDLQVAANHFGHRIHLNNIEGQQVKTIEPNPPAETEHATSHSDITIIKEKDGSYSTLIDGKKHGNGLFEALAHGLNHAKRSSEHDAHSVSQAIAKKVAEFPEEWDEHYETERKREELVPHAEKIKSEPFGTIHEIAVAEEKYGVGIDVVNKDEKVIRHSNIKNGDKKITLIYEDGHYDLIVDKKPFGVTSKHGDCLYAAIAEGLKSIQHGESEIDEHQVRRDLSEEILENPHRWHDEYRRKQSRENSWLWFRRGHLMKGAGIPLKKELLETPRRKTLARIFFKLAIPSFYNDKKVGCFCQLKVTINGKEEIFDGRGTSGGKLNPDNPNDESTIHAEDRVLKQIHKQLETRVAELKKTTNAEVTVSQHSLEMLLSHSPCERCRGSISSFFQDLFPHEEPDLTLRVAELYGKREGTETARNALASWAHGINANLQHCNISKLLKDNIGDIRNMFKNDTRELDLKEVRKFWKEVDDSLKTRAKGGKKDITAVRRTITKMQGNKATHCAIC